MSSLIKIVEKWTSNAASGSQSAGELERVVHAERMVVFVRAGAFSDRASLTVLWREKPPTRSIVP